MMNVEKCQKENGFTFLELIFVVLLLATLAGIAMLNYSRIQQDTAKELVNVDLKVIRAALRSYYLEKKDFPTALHNLVNENYLSEEPFDKLDPGHAAVYEYTRISASSCTIRSTIDSNLSMTVTP
jgi:prepilin-type N-terminal cleavage/methylation domain-containing protein